jgi:tetratricopeptide (TPR) repeat protein
MKRIVLLLLACIAVTSFAAAPSPPLLPGQKPLLQEWVRLRRLAEAEWKAGRRTESLAALAKVVELSEKVFGRVHVVTCDMASFRCRLLAQVGKYEEARRTREGLVEVLARLHGPDHWRVVDERWFVRTLRAQEKEGPKEAKQRAQAEADNYQAIRLHAAGQRDEALRLLERARLNGREAFGKGHPRYANVLHNLAVAHTDRGKHREALALAREALRIRERALGKRHPHYASSLMQVGTALRDTGEYREALASMREGARIHWEVLGPLHRWTRAALGDLGHMYVEVGDLDAALPILERCRRLSLEATGGKGPEHAIALDRLSHCYRGLGRFSDALKLALASRDLLRQAYGVRHRDYATALSNIADLRYQMGEFREAVRLNREALEITRRNSGEKHPDFAASLDNLATAYAALGDFRAALPMSRQALAIRKERFGEKHPLYAKSLVNLAVMLKSLGDTPGALPLYQQAVEVTRRSQGEDHPDHAIALSNLALLYQARKEHKTALPLFLKATDICQRALKEGHPTTTNAQSRLAGIYAALGDNRRAVELYRKTLAHHRKAFGENHRFTLRDRQNLACIGFRVGETREAQAETRAVVRLYEASPEARGINHINALAVLGEMYMRCDQVGAALPIQEKGLALLRAEVEADLSTLSERQQLERIFRLREQIGDRLSMPDEPPMTSYEHVLSWKGAVFSAQQRRRLFARLSADPVTARLTRDLQGVCARLASRSTRRDVPRKELEELTARKEQIEEELARRSEPFNKEQKPTRLKDLQAALPARAVLADFLVYPGYGPRQAASKQRPGVHVSVWVVRRDKAPCASNSAWLAPS